MLLLAACSRDVPKPAGKLLVAVTVDWEGAYFAGAGLDALDAMRSKIGADVPLTHFVCAAYFSKPTVDAQATAHLASAIRDNDEMALHLHGWKSLAERAGVQPMLSPSFLTGTSQLLDGFPDGDVGFDVDLDVYTPSQLRAMIRTSRELLEPTHIPLSTAFRAGGYLATPKLLQAIRDEGFTIDSSATTFEQFADPKDKVLRDRIREVWPKVTAATQPFEIRTATGPILEMPISAVVDYTSPAALAAVLDGAQAQLAAEPAKDVLVVIALHQESADEFAPRLTDTLAALRARDAGKRLSFVTISSAAHKLTPTSTPPKS